MHRKCPICNGCEFCANQAKRTEPAECGFRCGNPAGHHSKVLAIKRQAQAD